MGTLQHQKPDHYATQRAGIKPKQLKALTS